MKMIVEKSRDNIRFVLCCIIIIVVCLVSGNALAQTRSDTPRLLELSDAARMFDQCGFKSYARQMLQSALKQSETIEKPSDRILLLCHILINIHSGGHDIDSVSISKYIEDNRISADESGYGGFVMLALGRHEIAIGSHRGAGSNFSGALERAAEDGDMFLAGEVLLAQAQMYAFQNNDLQARKDLEESINYFHKSGELLYLSQARRLMAAIFFEMGRKDLARQENQKATNAIKDYAAGPMLNLKSSSGNAMELVGAHKTSYRKKEYHKAFNQLLTLLIVRKDLLQTLRSGILERELQLYESELLAQLAMYSFLDDHAFQARVLLNIGENVARNEISPNAKVKSHLSIGKYWRIAGNLQQAEISLSKARQAQQRVKSISDRVKIQISEEFALIHLALNQPELALAEFNNALEMANLNKYKAEQSYLRVYIKEVTAGNYDTQSIDNKIFDDVKTEKQEIRNRLMAAGPRGFQSPFVEDYQDSEHVSASSIAMIVELKRPRPTPPPVVLSPESRMKVKQFDKAIILLEEILEKEGESTGRLLQLTKCFMATREWDQAENTCHRILALEPDNLIAIEYLKSIQIRMKRKRMN